MWGETVPNWSYAVVNGDGSKLDTEAKTFTVDGTHVWSYEGTTIAQGEPAVAVAKSNSAYWLKFGSSGSNYFNPVILSTTAFNSNKVTKVRLNLKHNGTKVGTLTVKQGNITIGTCTTDNTSSIIDVECSQDAVGNGGKLEIKYEVAQALYIGKIEVWYETSGTTYSVTYDCNGGTSGCPDDLTGITPGTSITLAATPTKTGNTFGGWNDGSETYDAGAPYTVNSNVTFTAQWTANGGGEIGDESWVLTDLADLTEDDVFVIVGDNGSNYAMSNNNGTTSAPSVVAVTVSDGKITSTVADNIKWNISGDATDGYTFYPDGETETWLYCTNTNNGVRVGANSDNTFVISDGYLFHNGTSRYVGIYSDNSVAKDWRCYTSINANIKNQTFAFYKKVTGDVTVPSITASNVEIAYDATEGAISYTINNPAEDGELTAEVTEGSWLTLGAVGETVPFTATANDGAERTATVKLTYTYNSTETVTKTVTVTQEGNPSLIMTIAQVRAQGTGSVKTKGVVTSCVGTTGYIQDATAAICVYGKVLTVGDEITVEGTLTTYNGLLEITSPEFEVLSSGNTVTPEVMTIAEINASTNQGWLVKIEDATVTAIDGQNTTIAQGQNTIVVRGISGVEYEVGDVLTLTGNIGCYNTTQIANPTDVTVTVNEEASIEVKETAINVTAEGAEGTITVTYNNITEVNANVYFCDADGEEADYDWIVAEINDENNIEYLVDANEGAERKAYLKVYALDDEENEVYSELITFTQAAYVAPPTPVDGKYVKVTSTDDITDGQYLIVYEGNDTHASVAFNGGLETLDHVGNTIDVEIEDDEIAATDVTKAAEFTISVEDGTIMNAAGLYIGKTANSNGLDVDADVLTNTFEINNGEAVITASGGCTLRYNYASDQRRFRYYKTGQQPIQLYKFVSSNTVTASVSQYKWATFSSEYDLDFTDVTALEAHIVTGANGSTIVTEKVEGTVAAGTGLLLYSETPVKNVEIPVAEEVGVNYSNKNKLIAVTEDNTTINKAESRFTNYVLAVQGGKAVFAYIDGVSATLNKGKAYLMLEGDAPAPFLGFDGEGTTGINSVERGAWSVEGCYTLDGRRVAQPTKGLYIVNGKKVMVK